MADRSPLTAAARSRRSPLEKRSRTSLHGGGGFRGGKNSHKLRSLFKNFFTFSGDFEVQMMVLQK
jgi:hypothetical protein